MTKTLKLPTTGCTLEGFSCVDISTSHISLRDNELLTEFAYSSPKEHPQVILDLEYGYFVSAWHNFKDNPVDFEATLLAKGHSEAYVNIVQLAYNAGAKWINFDQDGPDYEFLPTFEWL